MEILKNQWKLTGECQLIPLGKGFFTIKLSNKVDQNNIRNYSWDVQDQVLRTRNWIPNFRPANQRTSHALIWVSLPGLSLEYWDEQTLFTICDAIVNPVKVDNATLKYSSGFATNVLEVLLHNLPKFCSKCKIVGHSLSECRFQKGSSNVNPTTSSSQGVKNQDEVPKVNNIQKPFDICPPPEVPMNVVNYITSTNVDPPVSNEIPISSERFSSLQDDEVIVAENNYSPRQEQDFLTPTKILKVVEDNSLEISEVKFINGKNGMHSMVIHNSVSNNKGNIWLFWNRNLPTPTVVSMSSQMIIVEFSDVLISGIHAHLIRRLESCIQSIMVTKFENWSYKVGLRVASDRSPLLGGGTQISKPHNAPMSFQKMWISHPKFMEVVEECWSEQIAGDPAFVFQQKLKKLKKVLNEWNWKVFGNINVQIKEAEEKVQDAMVISDNNPFDEVALNNLVEAQNLFNSKEVHLNTFLKQKSRSKWIQHGAANTGFLHTHLKIIQARNLITELEDGNGKVIYDQKQIQDILVKFFEDKFKYKEVEKVDHMLNRIPEVITNEDQKMLEAIPSAEEIKQILFAMDEDSSPGPDGFSMSFYKACWNVVHQDVVGAIQFCWRSKFILEGLNSIFFVLIPKSEEARNPKQFRPI
ncbi:uncharacterized protein LOC113290481 [Papaver somniferum]|uniref:uncharacterized protein LOC113290481 n=1 Tax=Papaver somniferum TaxID=3469 RepID=UPI000E6F9EAD|nr:uncharacterized protein LOC113290481 [Papaver somniferum]